MSKNIRSEITAGRTGAAAWPEMIFFSLGKKAEVRSVLPALAAAQAGLWEALNIYDDILDGAGGQENLWLANRYFRRFRKTLDSLSLSRRFFSMADRAMHSLEEAGLNEARGRRENILKSRDSEKVYSFDARTILAQADKSWPLALCPLAVLELCRKKQPGTLEAGAAFFRCFLAAKQLSDDCRDWQEDLGSGQSTPVTRLIIRSGPEYAPTAAFFHRVAPEAAGAIIKLTVAARKAAKTVRAEIRKGGLADSLLTPLEKAAREAEAWQRLLAGNPD